MLRAPTRALVASLIGLALASCLDIGDAAPARDASTDAPVKGDSGKADAKTDADASSDASGPAPDGAPCATDSDCEAGAFCSPPSAHGGGGSSKICMRLCCTSTDCSASEVCFPAPGGYRVCLPPTAAGGRPAPGAKGVGELCASNAECRSATCVGICTDTCCKDGDCPASASKCALGGDMFTSRPAFFCMQDVGLGAPGDSCGSAEDCTSGQCDPKANVCVTTCCAPSACPAGFACAPTTFGSDSVLTCTQATTLGAKTMGTACSASAECQSGLCVSVNGSSFCSAPCCGDADCENTAVWECRATAMPTGPKLAVCVQR